MPRSRRRRLVWSPEADRDLIDIWAYYARIASSEIADNLLREIDTAAQALKENPQLSRQRSDLLAGLRSVIVRPHVIFFRLRNGNIEIVRVLHGRRDFPPIFGNRNQ